MRSDGSHQTIVEEAAVNHVRGYVAHGEGKPREAVIGGIGSRLACYAQDVDCRQGAQQAIEITAEILHVRRQRIERAPQAHAARTALPAGKFRQMVH